MLSFTNEEIMHLRCALSARQISIADGGFNTEERKQELILQINKILDKLRDCN